jgi:hypothetical protein
MAMCGGWVGLTTTSISPALERCMRYTNDPSVSVSEMMVIRLIDSCRAGLTV